ncbi:restriction endonuclease subunit S [Bacteroides xylanisolvens]|uniref:restriction endonuclease subunit S n=1 Tax=Bacteroides xylanisolvens TaxID=371601 RepID=UPI003563AB67
MRFPEFKGEWKEAPLTKYLEFKNGLNTDSKKFGKGVKFISIMDILNNQYITYDNIIGLVNVDIEIQKRYEVNYGDILFQRSSETIEDIGRANVYLDNKPAIFGGFVIRGKKIGNYYPEFFKYLLSSPTARKKVIVKGAGSQHYNIGQEGLSSILLHFPPLQEQNKIAQFLCLLDHRIATQNKIIEKYESLIKGIRYYILEESTHYNYLGNLCNIIKGQQVNLDNLLKHGKYYVMNGGTQPSGYYNSYNTDAGTISISEGGNSCGYVQYNKENFWSGGHCYTLQNIKSELTEKYLYHYLKSNEKMIMALRVGSGLPNIQKKDLMSLRIPIPTKENQKKISCLLDSIEDKISVETNVLKYAIKQKSYLLRQMFI